MVHGSPAAEYGSPYFISSIPVAATVNLMVAQIGPKWSTNNSNGVIGPNCDTIKFFRPKRASGPQIFTDFRLGVHGSSAAVYGSL